MTDTGRTSTPTTGGWAGIDYVRNMVGALQATVDLLASRVEALEADNRYLAARLEELTAEVPWLRAEAPSNVRPIGSHASHANHPSVRRGPDGVA